MSTQLPPEISIVVPVFDEAGAVAQLAQEIATAFADRRFEIIFVDDASTDDTHDRLTHLQTEIPTLRVLRHQTNAGQSRAIRSGVLFARGSIIVTLDGDGQNDPAEAPALVDALELGPSSLAMIGGERAKRQDTASKRYASRLANAVRRRVLNDSASDTGCGLKVFQRDAYLRLPYFDHQHRYLPALMLREGYDVAFRPVGHRPRRSGRSKYTNLGRLGSAISDLAGLLWLRARWHDPGRVDEI